MSRILRLGAVLLVFLTLGRIHADESGPGLARWCYFPKSESEQQDLGLTDRQRKEWQTLSEEFERKSVNRALTSNLPGPETPEAERLLRLRERKGRDMAFFRSLRREYSAKLEKLLTTAQWERMQQIEWQTEGYRAYRDPEVARRIGLSRPQQAKLESIWQESSEEESRLLNSDGAMQGSPDVPKTIAKLERLYRNQQTNMEEVLTPEQKKRFEKIKGKPLGRTAPVR
jgi:hypothetical protein